LPFKFINYKKLTLREASFKQTYAVQDISQSPLVALCIGVKLAIARAHLKLIFDSFAILLAQIT